MELQHEESINLFEEFDASQHLKNLVIRKFENLKGDLEGKHFYSLKITKCPTRIDYHLFDFEKLQEISRKLSNGLTSLGSITNRQFWKRYFIGGVRTVSVLLNDENEFPVFSLNYLLYSGYDNLDVRILKNLSIRLKSIDSSLSFKLEYLGKYDPILISNHIPTFPEFDFDLNTINKLGVKTMNDIYDNQYQRPRFFGELFKNKISQ